MTEWTLLFTYMPISIVVNELSILNILRRSLFKAYFYDFYYLRILYYMICYYQCIFSQENFVMANENVFDKNKEVAMINNALLPPI